MKGAVKWMAGNHVAANPGLRQCAGDGSRQTDGFQSRMHMQRQPGGDVAERQAQVFGLLARQNNRETFGFLKAAQRLHTVQLRGIAQAAEHVSAIVQLWAHAA